MSPNIAGPRCIDTGLPCESVTTTCGGRVSCTSPSFLVTPYFKTGRQINASPLDREEICLKVLGLSHNVKWKRHG